MKGGELLLVQSFYEKSNQSELSESYMMHVRIHPKIFHRMNLCQANTKIREIELPQISDPDWPI